MNRNTLTIATLTLLLAGATAEASAQDAWRLELAGVYAESTSGGVGDGGYGGGLSIEYRATPRLGIELSGLTAEVEDETTFDLFFAELTTETEVRATPVLAHLNVHLTPDRRVDLYVGPVAGWVSMGDLTLRVRLDVPDLPPGNEGSIELPVEDQFTWGAHAGIDVRLGDPDSRSFLTAGLTWLELPLELDLPPADPAADDDNVIPFPAFAGDLDPLLFQVGYSYRF